MLKKILFTTLCVLMGAVFIISGFTKGGFPFLHKFTSPIEPFEMTFVDLGLANWRVAPFMARLLIGFEFFIGLSLILHIKLRKVVYKLGIALLAVFSIYLVLLMISGSKGNCGCFGTVFSMTPMWALIKNLIMIGVFILLYKFHEGMENKLATFLLWFSLITSLVLPFIWNPVALDYSEAYLNKPETNFEIPMDTLYNHATLNVPPRTLSKGKHVIAFMSLTCPHCRIAAKKMRIMNELNPKISFYFVLNGDNEKLEPFFTETKTQSIPHCMLLGRPFVYLAGTDMPAIYLVNNSVVEHIVDYMSLDQKEVEAWMEK
jgi:hypothetical protein